MKKQFFIITLMAILSINQSSDAQTFTTPVAYSNIYPVTAPAIGSFRGTKTISSYSDGTVNYPGKSSALYLTGWTGNSSGSGFSWRFTDPGVPANIYNQGVFPYTNVIDMEVGVVRSSGDPLIVAAYYEIGVGHKLDVYDMNYTQINNIVYMTPFLSYTVNLSSSSTYGRISMDCSDLKVAVCWDNADSARIEAMGIVPGSIGATTGPLVTIPNPSPFGRYLSPDIAIGNSNWGTYVQFVAHSIGGIMSDNLSEFSLTWSDLFSGSTSSFYVNDINPIITPANAELRPVIDAPDHHNVGNWAYTYGMDDSTINVRSMDYNTNWYATTAIVNNGNLGNTPLTGKFNSLSPSLSYSPFGDGIYVAWYATDGQFNGYVSVKIPETGIGLACDPDYMLLPNATTPAPYLYAPGPGIALSKNNEIYTDFLYATFFDADNLHHAYHLWGNPVFRPGATDVNTVAQQKNTLKISPNPFTDQLTVHVTTVKDAKALLQLVDLSGKTISQSEYAIQKGYNKLNLTNLATLPGGLYIVKVSIDGQMQITDQAKVIKN